MEYSKALEIATQVRNLLEPYCERIEIAGSIRRRIKNVKDIEIVAIPKPYETGLFESGIATIVNKWEKCKGELPCKYTQRIIPVICDDDTFSIKLDLFFAERGNWGLIYAIRTGSAEYSHKILAIGWVKRGYKSEGGYLTANGKQILVPEEKDLFKRIGLPFVEPQYRNYDKQNT